MFGVRGGIRRAFAQLIADRARVALLLGIGLALIAASPEPQPSSTHSPLPKPPPMSNSLTKAQMDALTPKVPLHSSYMVSTNKLGQVTNAKAAEQSKDQNFNVQTYGNALQAFIRTEDGKAVSGLYKMSYDFDPKTGKIKREVALVHAGGVNPDAEGAAIIMMDTAKKEAAERAANAKKASPVPHPAASPSAH